MIEDNLLDGGNYTIYVRDGGHGPPMDVVIRGNRFGRRAVYGALCPQPDRSSGRATGGATPVNR